MRVPQGRDLQPGDIVKNTYEVPWVAVVVGDHETNREWVWVRRLRTPSGQPYCKAHSVPIARNRNYLEKITSCPLTIQ